MKATRKLIPAIALLLVSAVLLSTASYAWFTTNKVVNATMSVSVTAPQNLQIKAGSGSTGVASDWANSIDLDGNAAPILTPVSSKDGVAFVKLSTAYAGAEGYFYDSEDDEGVYNGNFEPNKTNFETQSAATTGSAEDDSLVTYWLSYAFSIRASQGINNSDTSTQKLQCTITITSNEDPDEAEAYTKAMRVFILDAATNAIVCSYAGDGNAQAIYKSGESYALSEAVSAVAVSADFSLEVAEHKDLIAVVWLEGNDPACISANVDANPVSNIDIMFTLAD